MYQLAQTTSQSAADFAQGMCLCELAEEHGYELIPATETFAVFVGLVFTDDIGEITAIEKSENLAEYACAMSHRNLRCRGGKG